MIILAISATISPHQQPIIVSDRPYRLPWLPFPGSNGLRVVEFESGTRQGGFPFTTKTMSCVGSAYKEPVYTNHTEPTQSGGINGYMTGY